MKDRIAKRIAAIEANIEILGRIKPRCEESRTDPVLRGAILHYLYLTADSCVALAEMAVKERGFQPPDSYHEAIDLLGERGIIPAEFADRFAGIASFRNFLAHDYEKVDMVRICGQILDMLPDVEAYLKLIRKAFGV